MNDKELLDIYTDYLISSFGLNTETGLSRLLNGEISHDGIQRFLSADTRGSKELWQVVKPFVHQLEHVCTGVFRCISIIWQNKLN